MKQAQRAAQFIGAKVDSGAADQGLRPRCEGDGRGRARMPAPSTSAIRTTRPARSPRGRISSGLSPTSRPAAILILDEAYIHLSKSAVPGSDLVAADKDVIILRTFSKLYGMAGLRAGAAIARPTFSEVQGYGAGAMPLTGMVGANASLKVKTLVPGTPQDHRRRARRCLRVPRQAQLYVSCRPRATSSWST